MRKLFYLFACLLLIGLLISCRLTHKLERMPVRPLVAQPAQSMSTSSHLSMGAKSRMLDSITGVTGTDQVRTHDASSGEDIVTVALDQVLVTARSKNVPERFGKVNLDFIVTIPRSLLDKRWMVTLTPYVGNQQATFPLEDLVINGEIYRIYQDKGMRMYDALCDRYMIFSRDTAHIHRHFWSKYNLDKLRTDMRLDTIIADAADFRYYYTQEVAVDEGNSMKLHLCGNVFALDRSSYELPLSDTLTYYISSMTQFIDHAPRFVQRVIERHAEAHFAAHITFPVGKDEVDERLGDNATEIEKVKDIVHQLTWTGEFIIDSIHMTATASPEGAYSYNDRLAKRRAESLKSYFSKKLDDREGVDSLLKVRWVAEGWQKINDLIAQNQDIPHRREILGIIQDELNPDKREALIRTTYPGDYAYIRDSIYPALRVVDFQFCLRRAGMTKDTIHTTEPDTLYDRGRNLLKQRRYKEALTILSPYADYNTAITYMSLGYDRPAYEILRSEKPTGNTEYLLAILSARMGNEKEAVERFLSSCRMDESKIYRGALDPEIHKLITKYNLSKTLHETIQ